MIRLISFDVFGTLLDIEEDKYRPEAYDQLARFLGYHGIHVNGEGLLEAISTLTIQSLDLPRIKHPDVEIITIINAALAKFGQFASPTLIAEAALVLRAATTKIVPVQGAIEAVKTLYSIGHRVSICSNTQRAYTIGELRAFGLLEIFHPIVFSSDVHACKPDPAIFARVTSEASVSPDEIVHVGDNYIDDIEGAHNYGLRTIWLDRLSIEQKHSVADFRISTEDYKKLQIIIENMCHRGDR